MTSLSAFLKSAVTAFAVTLACGPVFAQAAPDAPASDAQPPQPEADPVTRLLGELAKPDQPGWEQIERAIVAEWSKSGSAAMDLLLSRGQNALSAGEVATAIAHFTALIDHAPEFAEGWNARATAFFQMERYGPALADIERTLALEPRHFGALTGLAIILEQVGYPEDALEAWRAVEAIHPHRPALKEAIERLEKEVGGRRL